MAYGNNSNGGQIRNSSTYSNPPKSSNSSSNQTRTAAPAAATATAATSDKIRITGLFSGKEGSKLVMSGSVQEDVTIPAGYSLSVFVKGGKSKNGKDLPPFELVAQPKRARTDNVRA